MTNSDNVAFKSDSSTQMTLFVHSGSPPPLVHHDVQTGTDPSITSDVKLCNGMYGSIIDTESVPQYSHLQYLHVFKSRRV